MQRRYLAIMRQVLGHMLPKLHATAPGVCVIMCGAQEVGGFYVFDAIPFHSIRSSHYYEPSFPQQPPKVWSIHHTILKGARKRERVLWQVCINIYIHNYTFRVAVSTVSTVRNIVGLLYVNRGESIIYHRPLPFA
jgi:hypothetical protein